MVTTDPGLLLAFVYFDQSHCGYIFDKDVEEILYTLGLNLSRAQVYIHLMCSLIIKHARYYIGNNKIIYLN